MNKLDDMTSDPYQDRESLDELLKLYNNLRNGQASVFLEEEAFEKVNASQYGIHCGVFTADEGRHWRALERLEVSGVIANDFPTLRFDNMPYGGVKRSGFGREGVAYAYDEYTTPKVLLQRR